MRRTYAALVAAAVLQLAGIVVGMFLPLPLTATLPRVTSASERPGSLPMRNCVPRGDFTR